MFNVRDIGLRASASRADVFGFLDVFGCSDLGFRVQSLSERTYRLAEIIASRSLDSVATLLGLLLSN